MVPDVDNLVRQDTTTRLGAIAGTGHVTVTTGTESVIGIAAEAVKTKLGGSVVESLQQR